MDDPDNRMGFSGGDPQTPPSKRPRLEPPRTTTTPTPGTPIDDDLDDLYGTPSHGNTPLPARDFVVLNKVETPTKERTPDLQPAGVIPGLGLLAGSTHHTTVDTVDIVRVEATSHGMLGSGLDDLYNSVAAREEGDDLHTPYNVPITDIVDAEATLVALPGNDAPVNASIKVPEALSSPVILGESEAVRDAGQVGLLPTDETVNGEPEWELDSSPVGTSSSSDASSSSTEGDDAEDYELLDAEEQARILMQEIGSDEEGDQSKNGKIEVAAQIKTKNETTEEKVERPNVIITVDMTIEHLGTVEFVVENLVVIKADVSGEYQVLESGSVLCLADRTVIGAVAETLGRVQQPYYSVRFNSKEEISQAGVTVGAKIFYVPQYSSRALTQTLKAVKGSDASNLHDEEVGEDEQEFSNDEAEAEHKRKIKQRSRQRKGSRPAQSVSVQRNNPQIATDHGLNYEDAPAHQENDDGEDLYTPLARPSNFQDLIGAGNARPESDSHRGSARRNPRGGRGKDRGRGGRRARWGRGDRNHRTDQSRDTHRRRQEDVEDQPRRSSVPYEPTAPAYGNSHRPNSPRDMRRRNYEEYQERSWQAPVPHEPTGSSYSRRPDERWDDHDGRNENHQGHPQQLSVSYGPTAPAYGYGYQNTQIPSTAHFSYAPQPSPLPAPQPVMSFPQMYPPTPYGWAQPSPHVEFPFAHTPGHATSLSPPAVSPAGPLPAGSYVNPAFFRNPQSTPMRSQASPPPRQGMSSISSQGGISGGQADSAFRAAQEKLDILRGLSRNGSGSP
ncbi:MAG: hypothetical protein M1816_000789 [Peltula sp. TS41687]|nr:MAG: hypothetical protein M1816_000789 [Peltula sp. TS41687]